MKEKTIQKNEQPQFLSLEMEDYERGVMIVEIMDSLRHPTLYFQSYSGIRNMQQQIKSMEEEMARLNNLVDSKTKEIESNLKEMGESKL